jgi:glycosyl transferase family 11
MTPPTVVAKIVGGIGNQLFCYAAARRLALENDAALCLDLNFFRSDVHYGREYRLDSFALPPHRVVRTRRALPRWVDLRVWRLQRKAAQAGLLPGRDWLIEAVPGVFDPRLLRARVTRTTVTDGYWQDERYFADVEKTLRAELVFRPEVGAHLRETAARIAGCNSVAVHCRRMYDAAALPAHYYSKAIEALATRVPAPEFFCFGDDPRWLVEQLPRGLRCTVVHDPGPRGEMSDLRLMSGCRHFIIANSTFSWWGAWLGAEPGKIVMAPRPKGLKYEVRSARGWTEIDW